MEISPLIIKLSGLFVGLMLILCLVIILCLHIVFSRQTEGAIKRLEGETQKAKADQAEVTARLRKTETDLKAKQEEAKELADKMRAEAEAETKAEREKIVNAARAEGEEIITKAQNATVRMKEELAKENDRLIIDFSTKVVNFVLSHKGKGALDEVLVNDFIDSLKEVDMSKIDASVSEVEIITLNELDASKKSTLNSIIKDKLAREVNVKTSVDPELGGGAILKFGSMALDGSIKNLIREAGIALTEEVEARV